MAFTPVNDGDLAVAPQLQQVIDALQGVSGAGQPVSLTSLEDDDNYALSVRNLGSGGAFRVLSSADVILLDITDSGVDLGSISSLELAAGTVSAPSLSGSGSSSNTGLYFPATDQLGVTIDGTQRGLWTSSGLTVTGSEAVTNNSATVWAETVKNSNASGRGLNVLDPDGRDFVTTMRVSGVDTLNIGLQDTPLYAAASSRVFVAHTATINTTMVNLEFNANAGTDSGALRATFNQTVSGATWGRAGEFQSVRTTGDNGLYGIEVGTHSTVAVTALGDHAGIVGIYIANQGSGWTGVSTVRGDSGILIQGDKGYKSSIVARDTDSSTVLLRGVSFTTGNDVAGDLMAASRIYSQAGGAAYRIGIVSYLTAPASVTDGGIWFDPTSGREALWLASAKGGVAYRPTLINPDGGGANNAGVGICVTPANLAAQSGVIGTTLQIGEGGTISSKIVSSLVTPPSGYSSTGFLTNGRLARKTAAGVTYEVSDSQTVANRNRITNGAMAVNQRVTMPTTDDTYCLDQWNLLLEAANAATVAQETSDVPTDGSKFGLKLTVGSGNNNKFGIAGFLEYADCSDLRGKVVSLQFKMKSTAGIADVRAAVIEWTSTADTITSDVVGTWGAALTNPTLATNWAYCTGYTPISLAPTTSWATYKIEGVTTVGASTNNLAVLIWVDDKTTTQTTDILRITDVQLEEGTVCTQFERQRVSDDLLRCYRYYYKSYSYTTAPGTATNVGGQHAIVSDNVTSKFVLLPTTFGRDMRVVPTVTTYDTSGNSGKISTYDAAAALTANVSASVGVTQPGTRAFTVGHQGTIAGTAFHFVADATL